MLWLKNQTLQKNSCNSKWQGVSTVAEITSINIHTVTTNYNICSIMFIKQLRKETFSNSCIFLCCHTEEDKQQQFQDQKYYDNLPVVSVSIWLLITVFWLGLCLESLQCISFISFSKLPPTIKIRNRFNLNQSDNPNFSPSYYIHSRYPNLIIEVAFI